MEAPLLFVLFWLVKTLFEFFDGDTFFEFSRSLGGAQFVASREPFGTRIGVRVAFVGGLPVAIGNHVGLDGESIFYFFNFGLAAIPDIKGLLNFQLT